MATQMHDANRSFGNHPDGLESDATGRLSQKTMAFDNDLPPRLFTPTRLRRRLLWAGLVLAALDLGVMPIVYYYSLTYASSLTPEYVFIVITCLFCMMTFAHYTHRCFRLFFKCSDRYGPIGWSRKWRLLEFTNANCALCATIFETCLVIGTAYTNPIVRLCTMPPTIICWYFGLLFLLTSTLHHYQVRLPFAQSSTPKGAVWRPAFLTILEDTHSIEGRGELPARQAVLARWEASPAFRRMIRRINWAWGCSFVFIAIVSTALIYSINNVNIAFGVGWGLPFVWSFFATLMTLSYVKGALRDERNAWRGSKGGKEGAMGSA